MPASFRKMAAEPFDRFARTRWGELSATPLLMSVFSGVLLTFKYDVGAAYSSVVSIDLLVPFGSFIRGMHYYSSQVFFVFFIFHLVAILMRIRGQWRCQTPAVARRGAQGDREREIKQWLLLVAALPVTTLLLFTGYVLKMDATGRAAGAVAENIILSLPWIGPVANRFLFSLSENGLRVVYANHIAGLTIIWLALLWSHLRRYSFRVSDHGYLLALLFFLALVIPAPLTPEWPGVMHLAGPWFFIGLQELLRYLQPFWAGIVFPLLPIVALALIPCRAGMCRWGTLAAGVWLFLYLILTVVGWGRGIWWGV